MNDIPPLWREKLIYMLGAGDHLSKKHHGYRNHYYARIGSKTYDLMLEMEKIGFVKAGKLSDEHNCQCQYFHATVAGCQAIGLSKAAIKRAMEGI